MKREVIKNEGIDKFYEDLSFIYEVTVGETKEAIQETVLDLLQEDTFPTATIENITEVIIVDEVAIFITDEEEEDCPMLVVASAMVHDVFAVPPILLDTLKEKLEEFIFTSDVEGILFDVWDFCIDFAFGDNVCYRYPIYKPEHAHFGSHI